LSTYFVVDNYQKLTKFELDKVWNDKKSKVVADDFYMEIFFEQTQKPEDVPKVDRVINLDVNFFPDRSKLSKEEEKEIDEIYEKYGKQDKDTISKKEDKIMKMETMEEKLEREEEEKIEEK
jgi:hypothetical protein